MCEVNNRWKFAKCFKTSLQKVKGGGTQRPCIQHKKGSAEERRIVSVLQHHVCMHSDFSQHADKWMCKICAQSADRPEFLFSRHDLFSFGALSSICIVYCLRQVNGLIGAAHKVKSRRCSGNKQATKVTGNYFVSLQRRCDDARHRAARN